MSRLISGAIEGLDDRPSFTVTLKRSEIFAVVEGRFEEFKRTPCKQTKLDLIGSLEAFVDAMKFGPPSKHEDNDE